jgi:probable H4MPT-linked C1 transfer pathway protein
MKILALDIGGANTKALFHEDGCDESSLTYFPVWKKKSDLTRFLSCLKSDSEAVVVTGTAELCDAFESKAEGARFISNSCIEAFDDPFFLTTRQTLVKKDEIRDYKDLFATNWVASSYLMSKMFGKGILVDVGSTTTDIIPFGKDNFSAKTDLERLKNSELVYTGYLRTPVNTVVSKVPIRDEMVPISSEYFAITADVYNVLWGVDYVCETPDGRGKSKEDSMVRLARLLCADIDEVAEQLEGICRYVYGKQIKMISYAIEAVSKREGADSVVVFGTGRILGIEAARALGFNVIDLEEKFKDAWNLPCLGMIEMVLDKGAD